MDVKPNAWVASEIVIVGSNMSVDFPLLTQNIAVLVPDFSLLQGRWGYFKG